MNPTVVGGALGAFVAVALLVILGVGWAVLQSRSSTSQIVGFVRHPISGWIVALGVLWGASTGMPQMIWVALAIAIICIVSFVLIGMAGDKLPRLSLPQIPHLPIGRRRNKVD